ncbi:MAG: MOSC domain-containing protein [Campylobacterota bacterium]|nr:MOSC domain-containing protein [Campylobacterota bacterium]
MTNKNRKKIIKLFISQQKSSHRIEMDTLTLDEKGVLNDKFYNKNIDRSILISSIDSYTLAANNNIVLKYGLLGENIIVNFNPYTLKIGTILKIGTTELMISQPCTICDHLTKIDVKLPKLLQKDRGIFAKVIKPGSITLADEIHILN